MSFNLFTAYSLRHCFLQEQCEQFTDEVKMLLENYNKTVSF